MSEDLRRVLTEIATVAGNPRAQKDYGLWETAMSQIERLAKEALKAAPVSPTREDVARAIFRCDFHPDESDVIIAKKWAQWPSERHRVFRRADAVLNLFHQEKE